MPDEKELHPQRVDYYLKNLFAQAQANGRVNEALANLTAEKILMTAITEFLLPPDPREHPIEFCVYVLTTILSVTLASPEFKPFMDKLFKFTPKLDEVLAKVFGEAANCIINFKIYVNNSPCSLTHIWSETRSLSSVENAYKHFTDHAHEFGFVNSKQYVDAANEFLKKPPAGILRKVRTNGDVLLYDQSTNTFGVLRNDGVPRTMFKPTDGVAYFNRQR